MCLLLPPLPPRHRLHLVPVVRPVHGERPRSLRVGSQPLSIPVTGVGPRVETWTTGRIRQRRLEDEARVVGVTCQEGE